MMERFRDGDDSTSLGAGTAHIEDASLDAGKVALDDDCNRHAIEIALQAALAADQRDPPALFANVRLHDDGESDAHLLHPPSRGQNAGSAIGVGSHQAELRAGSAGAL